MNSIEEKLWNYIDGTCTPDEQRAIKMLIEQDEAYRNKYNELLKLNNEFSAIELDEPPMAFTYNVMETIRAEEALKPLKAKIDKRIIRGIAIFFVFTISAMLIMILANINWSASAASSANKFTLPDVKHLFNGALGKGFLFLDTILVLFLLDGYLRKKGSAKADISVQNGGQLPK